MALTALLIAAVLTAAAAVGCAVVRIVPAGHRGVVTRGGRVARSRPSGLVMIVPGLERIEMVALHPSPIGPLSVTAQTRDGFQVRLVLNVLWCVSDPRLVVHAAPEAREATTDAVQRALHLIAAKVDLTELARDTESIVSPLPVIALPLVLPLGVEVVDVELLDAQVQICPELLRLLA